MKLTAIIAAMRNDTIQSDKKARGKSGSTIQTNGVISDKTSCCRVVFAVMSARENGDKACFVSNFRSKIPQRRLMRTNEMRAFRGFEKICDSFFSKVKWSIWTFCSFVKSIFYKIHKYTNEWINSYFKNDTI